MIELLLSFLSDDLSSIFFPAFAFISGILLIAFMAIHSKSKGKSLSAPWYICAFLLPLVTAIMYLVKAKKEKAESENKKQKSLSHIFAALFAVAYIGCAVFGVYMAVDIADYNAYFVERNNQLQDTEELDERLSFKNETEQYVYYDAKGNEYTQSLMVKIYDKDGKAYEYARFQEFDEDGGETHNGYYLDGSGEKLEAKYCFVDEDGYFVYNKKLKSEADFTIGDFYFNFPYTDSEGNRFYPATLASWDSKGNLILS